MSLDFLAEILSQLASYFPLYVILVLIPMLIRVAVERAAGITAEVFETRVSAMPSLLPTLTYEGAFKEFVLSALYYPLLEELFFRGLPLWLCGFAGLVVGSAAWVFMHPAWQLKFLRDFPLRTKILFTATTTFYYACCAVFYGVIWLAGAGAIAVLYHMIHNGWLTLSDLIKKVEVPTPWKKFRYVSKKPVEAPMPVVVERENNEEAPRGEMLFVKRAPQTVTAPTSFVKKRGASPPAPEPSEPEPSMTFVKRRSPREGAESSEVSSFSFVKRLQEG